MFVRGVYFYSVQYAYVLCENLHDLLDRGKLM